MERSWVGEPRLRRLSDTNVGWWPAHIISSASVVVFALSAIWPMLGPLHGKPERAATTDRLAIPVILRGGADNRLWPVPRKKCRSPLRR
jgi:hypothetical protein